MFQNPDSLPAVRQNPLKLRPPRAGQDLVARSAFCQRTEESGANLVLVSAPAGYGKSTAMGQLHHHLADQGAVVGWLTLDPSDNDLGRFSQYVWLSLGATLPAFQGQNFEASAMEASSATASGRSFELLDALALHEGPLALFIDEFEHITSSEVLAFVMSLVSSLNAGQRLILGSRHKTMLPLGRLRVQGKLLELEVPDLRFSLEETRHYVRNRLKAELGESDVARLQESTDGWAAALQLTTSALIGKADPSAVLKGLNGPSRGIADYLAEDVLDRLPPALRTFVIQSSLFESFCPEMCDAVFDRQDSTGLLLQTDHDNLFLQIIDADGRWYRYHPLFRDFLQSQIHRLPGAADERQGWHLRAAQWLDGADKGLPAIEHALAAGAPELAARLMARRATDYVRTGQFGIVSKWLEALPDAVLQSQPTLLIAGAYTLAFLHRYQDATRLVGLISPEVRASDEFAQDLLVLQVMLGAWMDRLPEALRTALAALPTPGQAAPYMVGLINNAAAYGEIAVGNYYAAHQHLVVAKHALEPIKAIHGLSYSQCFEGAIDLLQGNAVQACARFRATLSGIISGGYRFTSSTAVAAAHLIEAFYELNELDSAEMLIADYLSLIRDSCLPDHLIVTYRAASRIHFIRGRQREALETLDCLQDMGDLRGIPRLSAAARQGKLRLALRAGDLAAARRLLTLLSEPEIWRDWQGLFPYAEDLDDPFIAEVRIALVAGTAPGMTGRLEEAIQAAEMANRGRRAIRLRCLLAQALESARKRQHALEVLERALVQAQSKGLFRVVADDSWLLAPLLEALEVRSHVVPRTYITALLKAASETNVAYMPSTLTSEAQRNPEGDLSQRELQILRLVAEGCSNKDLSRKLFVTENTIETHLRRIYAKLGTRNRTQAVARAREKGLI